jgi:hypothetical protein
VRAFGAGRAVPRRVGTSVGPPPNATASGCWLAGGGGGGGGGGGRGGSSRAARRRMPDRPRSAGVAAPPNTTPFAAA